MKISIPDHVRYFAGYMDAVGRVFTGKDTLVCLTASLIPY